MAKVIRSVTTRACWSRCATRRDNAVNRPNSSFARRPQRTLTLESLRSTSTRYRINRVQQLETTRRVTVTMTTPINVVTTSSSSRSSSDGCSDDKGVYKSDRIKCRCSSIYLSWVASCMDSLSERTGSWVYFCRWVHVLSLQRASVVVCYRYAALCISRTRRCQTIVYKFLVWVVFIRTIINLKKNFNK